MALESFPRLRSKEFTFGNYVTVPLGRSGRMDLISADVVGSPVMYKAMAAYSGVVNPTAARPGIRVDSEALRNELILRGVPEDEVESKVNEINETRIIGNTEWQGYSDNRNGVISSVDGGGVLLIPEMNSMFAWANRYANLMDEDSE